ncbi:MAG: hypothetical protein LAP13_10190 [Acidobacteriia bacterium]|nr:hypothetical protein [Terriglobia bacterium]
MKTVVVGGHSRNIGKTSVMAGVIRALPFLDWTGVKITQYGHGVCSHDGEPCGCAPDEHPFALTEETDARGRGDTCRFLAAGARRALWLRVRQGQLATAFPSLAEALRGAEHAIIESNSILEFLEPDLYLVVLDPARRDFKDSTRRFFNRADALVAVEPLRGGRAWPALDASLLEGKPLFQVSRRDYFSRELCRLVCRKLGVAERAIHPQQGD